MNGKPISQKDTETNYVYKSKKDSNSIEDCNSDNLSLFSCARWRYERRQVKYFAAISQGGLYPHGKHHRSRILDQTNNDGRSSADQSVDLGYRR